MTDHVRPPPDFLACLDADLAGELIDLQPSDDDDPQRCGRYHVVRRIGRGGMGVVLLGHDPELDRLAAIKLLPSHLLTDDEANRRLIAEARAASALDHPNIATIYEIAATEDGRTFFAMAWCEGGTLRDRLRDGALSIEEACRIGAQVAEGLAAAHARGITHRDVKPENIAFGSSGVARILDFGIASVSASAATRADAIRGTVAYMSPEQTSSSDVDHRCDVWALGVVLYEMLAGTRPFPGDSNAAVITAIRADDPLPPRQLRPDIPAVLVDVVERCLRKDPADRHATAEEIAIALRTAAIGDPAGSQRGTGARTRARRVAMPVLALIIILGAIAAAQRIGGGGAFAEPARVLVAEFDAPAAAQSLGVAAREALTVDLAQSEFLRVVGRSEVAAILRQMAVADTASLTLPLALEVAERAGAGAVLTASLSQLGAEYVLSGRAVQPATGEDLFAVRTSSGPDALLDAVERLSHAMRGRLGEQRAAIRQSRPLPAVSTSSLEALRLYAEAERLLPMNQDAAAGLVAEALRSDPEFAMAHRMAAAIAYSQLRIGDARTHLTRAWELRDRVGDRERWHIEALYYASVTLEPRKAADAYEMLLTLDPTDWVAAFNVGGLYQSWLDDAGGAYRMLRRARDSNPHSPLVLLGLMNASFALSGDVGLDTLEAGLADLGAAGVLERWGPARAFAAGRYEQAHALCDVLLETPDQAPIADDLELCGSFDVAAGRLQRALHRLERAERMHTSSGRLRNAVHAAQALVLAHALRGERDAALGRIRGVLDSVDADALPEPDRYITRTNLQLQAALLGATDVMDRIAITYPQYPDPDHWFGRAGDALVRAARQINAGESVAALATLRAGWPADRDAIGWRIWNELLHGLAFEQVGQPDSAAVRFARAADSRFHTFPALTKQRIYLPVALARLRSAAAAAGDTVLAAGAERRLGDLGHGADAAFPPHAGVSVSPSPPR